MYAKLLEVHTSILNQEFIKDIHKKDPINKNGNGVKRKKDKLREHPGH